MVILLRRGGWMKKELQNYKLINDIFSLSRRIRLLRKQNMATDLLTEAELLILDYLAQNKGEATTMSRTANAIGLTYSHLSKIINSMEISHEWVERKIDPSDRRQILLSLSSKGKEILTQAQNEERDRMGLIIPNLTEDEKATISDAVTIFNRILDGLNE